MLTDLLRAAVADATRPIVTCAVLSGGLDSSTVVALAPYDLATYTGWYDEPGCDERHYARLVARGPHTEVQITPEDLVEHFDAYAEAVSHLADPMGMGGFGQFMVARRIAASGFTTVLSGEGSDELFGGYVRQLIVAGEEPPEAYAAYRLPDGYPRSLPEAQAHDAAALPDLLAVDTAVLSAFNLRGATPFLDWRVILYALGLPPSERIWKRHLRDAVRGIVPDAIVDRRDKMGFPTPFVRWAQSEPVRGFVLDRLGYLPDPAAPHARGWWHEMIRASDRAAVA